VITVATWNVLHRVHAENWGEDIPGHWPDESERVSAVTARLAGCAEQVVALQEVSGDQLTDLRRAMPDRTIHALRYPRVPSPRNGTCSLKDPSEYLVLLVNGPARQVAAEAFDDDPGKGLLAVRTGWALVVATHVSFGRRRARQLARLGEAAATSTGPVVLLGDFNADRVTVAAALGPGFTVADLPPDASPTRPRGSGIESQHIDHVVVRGGAIGDAVVERTDGLSDHNLLRVNVTV
jgi:endonuclease/exonuclease/phosphatase family metal-dependent hydrolase